VAAHLKDVVNDALELASIERDEFLVRVCGGDDALLGNAREMLGAHERIGDFLEPPDVSRGLWVRALEHAAPELGKMPALVGAVLDDRYQLEERLGTGSSGAVYDSTDLLTGERVAVKVLTALHMSDLHWYRRELTALRLLELPGVVRLLDDGVHMGLPFLVMPKIEGTRFPGRLAPVPWKELAETAIALLETLARIHAHGVVHGDLKPANVLVDDKRRPMVLDLGLSSGPSVPSQMDLVGGIAGTPAYLSPEQLMGDPATPQSDLYAVGVMLHEALTGTMPHPAHKLDELVEARLSRPAPSLRERGVDGSTCPVDTLDSLLAIKPEDREQSAAQVAARLRGETPPLELLRTHPALQHDEAVTEITNAALSSREVIVWGPEQSGRRRCMRRVAGRLRRAGKSVHWLDLEGGSQPHHADVVIINDADFEVGDRADCVIRVLDHADAATIRIRPLSRDALEALFAGSNRIFHLREDAARELHRRTKGWQLRVAEELSAWLRAGLAQVEEGAIVLERGAIDLLGSGFRVCPLPDTATGGESDPVLGVLAAAGPVLDEAAIAVATKRSPAEVASSLATLVREGKIDQTTDGLYQTTTDSIVFPRPQDHAAVARGLAPGAPGRLKHLVASEATEGIAAEARHATLTLLKNAQVGRARVAATQGLAAVRGHGLGPDQELPLLSALVQVAAAENTERGLELTLYELGRASFESTELEKFERLMRVALLSLRRDGDRALALADTIEPFDDPDLERFRQAARAMAARCGQRDRSEEVLRSVEDWAARNDDAQVHCKLLEWRGWAAYMQADYRTAIVLQEEALTRANDVQSRLSCTLNVAETRLEAGDYDRARELAEQGKTAAADCRYPFCEARAEAVLRYSAYRGGYAKRVDQELIDALPALHHSNLEAQINLNEGAVAWRLGDVQTARHLVRHAYQLLRPIGHIWGVMLTRSFLAALGEDGSLDSLAERACDCPMPGLALQALGLLARADPSIAPQFRNHARQFAEQIAPKYWGLRREVCSVDECLEWIQQERTK